MDLSASRVFASKLPAACVPLVAPRPVRPAHRAQRTRLGAAADDDARAAQMKAMEEAMQDPAAAAQVQAMQQMMSKPEVVQQMSQMQAVMSNPSFMQKMQELREDPELQSFFEQIKAGGMPAMMQAMNDPMFLQKFSEKMGDLDDVLGPAQPPPTTAAAAAAQGPPAEVNDILDAAKVGDIEAIEDFVAIGKCDITDEAGRGALHYAVAYNQGAAASALLEAGADVNAVDSEGNTPLHFACGYGRGNAARALLAKGADTGLKNSDGKGAADVVKEEPRNPINQDEKLLAVLEGAPLETLRA